MADPISSLYEKFLAHPVVSTDTRNITPGCIFFALKGENFNGNKFAADALAKGAAFAVVDEKEFAGNEKCILVPDVLTALQELAKHHRKVLGGWGLEVLALTGSNGKTTTKELIARVLCNKFNDVLATQGNLNNHIGVPLTLLRLNSSYEIAVIEMGANHQKEIELLSSIAEPDYGLITNIGLAHLEGFGGPEGVLKGKTELFDDLRKRKGVAFVFSDDERIVKRAEGLTSVTYGTDQTAAVNGKIVSSDPFVKFSWQAEGIPMHEVSTHLAGEYNLPNLLAACAVGTYFGIPANEIDSTIANYIPDMNRSQMEKRGTNTFILDYYNANPSSMEAAINNLAKMKAEKKIVLLGDMFELGEESAKEHQRIVDLIGKKLPGCMVVLVGKNFANTKDDFGAIRVNDSGAAGEWLKKEAPQESLILIKGSRGTKMENVIT
ncbi:MAG TPA: UDP-N-acetylmuramoyl-tripeptide--D-alanyl-D-alanine ligase [Bacteroidia bacterium]|jgi:UDP-N-acetylmuramoyl-tripeptide--D-alanyl-D-alanine ligase|nr:UDP-N-acetylmuramoyl-tripeptide--D-alanyl-D-alanine ligase [Bacteroidia bacterium]